MALIKMDGFDYANNAELVQAGYYSYGWDFLSSFSASNKRFNGYGINIAFTSGQGYGFGFSIPNYSTPTFIFGIAVMLNDTSWGIPRIYCNGNVEHINFRFQNNWLGVYRGETLLYEISTSIVLGQWNYFEFKVTISNTAGVIVVRKNGQVIGEWYNIDTNNGGTDALNGLNFNSARGAIRFDDFYLCDTTGTINNDFLGDVTVVALAPTANGSVNNFTPSSGSNFQCVDDFTNDGDATYVSISSAGQDLYTIADLNKIPNSIFGLEVKSVSRKNDTGVASLRNKLVSGSNTSVGIETFLNTSYAVTKDIFELDPSTGSVWTKNSIDNIEVGIERIS